MSNQKQLATSVSIYAADADDSTPPIAAWSDKLMPIAQSKYLFRCGMMQSDADYGIAYFEPAAGKIISTLPQPDKEVLFFDSVDRTQDAASDLSKLDPDRHGGNPVAAFLDGHAKRLWHHEPPPGAPRL